MPRSVARPIAGVLTVASIAGIVLFAAHMFGGGFTKSVPVTVLSSRAGLVMYPGARVQMRGIQVGKVASIESLPAGKAEIRLALDPQQLPMIPANVAVGIASTTVFGAKYVDLIPPAEPWTQSLRPGQTLDAGHVTVELNSIFQQLTSVLSQVQPDKLNETLGAIASGFNGRGEALGRTLVDLDALLSKLNPSLQNLRHDIVVAPEALNAYADAAPDLLGIADNASAVSQTIVDEQKNLDALLVGVIGLADIGNQVVGENQQGLTDVLRLLVPTTDLTSRYHEALNCALAGLAPLIKIPPMPVPGILVSTSFTLGVERYRYPGDLPKVAATGGPHCADVGLPQLPTGSRPPFLVADIGSNPWKYGNQGLLLNADGLKQMLFGPLDGLPRNSAQIGQPG